MRLLLVVAVLAAGCGKAPSEAQCSQLLDHLVDLEFKKAGATATADTQKTDLAKQKQSVIDAKSTEFMTACTDKTARTRVECALAADDLDGVAKCDTEDQ
ncbi:MAG: hypothetical protein ABI867_24335 [Kofleriaceae bacterium]